MIAVDTNVLVRLLTGDDPAQTQRAVELFAQESILIPKTVLLETEWVLRYRYELAPTARQRMAHHAQGCFQNRFEISRAAERFANVVHAPYCPVQRGEPAYPGLASAV